MKDQKGKNDDNKTVAVPVLTDCEDAARGLCNNDGAQPDWKNGGIHMVVDNTLQGSKTLTANKTLAILTIDAELARGLPVMVGVSYNGGEPGNSANTNKLVGHFVVIVGRGNDEAGNYYTYWDNAYNGTDTKINRFYLTKSGTLVNNNGNGFVVAEVRPNTNK